MINTTTRAARVAVAAALASASLALTAAAAEAAPVATASSATASSATASFTTAVPMASTHAATRAIPFTAATVTQNGAAASLTWAAGSGVQRVKVYAGRDQKHIDRSKPVAVAGASASGLTVDGLGEADRWWFELVPDHGQPITVADRSLHLASAPNFRDAGGYFTADGRWVRMGVLYRSGDLSTLTDADLAKLKRLGIRTDIDLRTDGERVTNPDRLPDGATLVVANVLGDLGSFSSLPATDAAGESMMEDGERQMVSSATAQAAYRTMVKAAIDTIRGGGAVVYHCSAGKDRTGWASALLLTAVGVDRSTVTADYLASNTYRAEENAAALAQVPEALRPGYKAILDVRKPYLDAGFDEVAARYGTFDGYLRGGLRLSASDLRQLDALLLGR